ncbi:MAG: ubiquinol-cytochrome c reductase iron-sulfur subunit [Anaerolineales bacterium]|nr:ubiquinol-cytochrome c reductase iron-sulfur subunit [Anaerolineales bacterium]
MAQLSRRDFVKLATQALLTASGLLGLNAFIRLVSAQTSAPPPTQFDLGPASSYPLGSRTVIPDVPAILLHTEAGFSALSLVCTHLGCTLDQTSDGFTCPCHGSQFGADGFLQRGPAKQPLAPLPIEQNAEGHLILRID